jgi:hypothetical protein
MLLALHFTRRNSGTFGDSETMANMNSTGTKKNKKEQRKERQAKGVSKTGITRDEARNAILKRLADGDITADTANELLKKDDEKRKSELYCKVSAKGACSVYGLQRMPVTLYVEQWHRLLDFGDELKDFLAAHEGELSLKGDKKKTDQKSTARDGDDGDDDSEDGAEE